MLAPGIVAFPVAEPGLRSAADVLKIRAKWLVHAGCGLAATSAATSFRRVDRRRDW